MKIGAGVFIDRNNNIGGGHPREVLYSPDIPQAKYTFGPTVSGLTYLMTIVNPSNRQPDGMPNSSTENLRQLFHQNEVLRVTSPLPPETMISASVRFTFSQSV